MPRTKEQFEEIRQERKFQIMDAALDLFAAEGYGHVSISALASHLGISKGLMYNYFQSKEELLQEALNYATQEIFEYFDPNHDGVLTEEEFILFIRKTFELMREKNDFYTKFFGLIIQPNVMDLAMKSDMMHYMHQYLEIFKVYFENMGFEDPMLEVLNLSIMIEGLGMMMVFYSRLTEVPEGLFEKLEERIIKTYTRNEKA